MVKQITKRDGAPVAFDISKIRKAIQLATERTDFNNNELLDEIVSNIEDQCLMFADAQTIADIQKIVEKTLIRFGLEDVAREYIEYRTRRDIERSKHTKFMSDVEGIIGKNNNKDLVNENSNKDSRLISTQRDLLAGIISEDYAKKYILPKHVVRAHDSGDIHHHDLSAGIQPSVNCCLVDLENMLTNGFRCGNADIEPPKSITVAATVTTQIIAAVASSNYGGTTINRIDEVLAPYVTKSYEKHLKTATDYNIPNAKQFAIDKTEKEVYDAMQLAEYQTNSLFTTNG